jgi:Tol biopolymer transport system component
MRLRSIGLVMVIALAGSVALGSSQATAISTIPGQFYGLADVSGTNGDLFRSTTSSSWRRVTSGLRSPESVSASPNGRFAVMCATRGSGGIYRIYRVSARGGTIRNLIGNRQGCGQTVSPDNRKVAYITDTGSGTSRLNVVSTRGGKVRNLYRFSSFGMYEPVWAGGRIFFERRVTRNPSSPLEIYSIRARDGKKLRRHTNHGTAPIGYGLRDVSPDGKRLLVAVDRPEASLEELSILSLRNRTWSTLISVSTALGRFIGDAAFSPSGESLAYLTGEATPLPFQLWVGPSRPGSWYSAVAGPASSTSGLFSIDWVRR